MKPLVSFTTNACVTDIAYIGQTLAHMKRSLDYPFIERIVALDPGVPSGKYGTRGHGDLNELQRILADLLEAGIINKVVEIPTDETAKNNILHKYFGNSQVDLKDFDGAPIYQYLYAMDICEGDYILHVDSDMLFFRGNDISWIEKAIAFMTENPQVVFTTPSGGPPQAKSWIEKITGINLQKHDENQWHKATSISTRYFLIDKARFTEKMLPLEQGKPKEPLEKSLTYTAKIRGYERWTLDGANQWAIHPEYHDINFIAHLTDLIAAVENGMYPFKRGGYQWDMCTQGDHIKPWLKVIRKMKKTSSAK